MAKFVKERARVIPRQKRRIRLREVADIDRDRPHLAAQPALAAEIGTPRARAFRGPREIVSDEHRDMRAIARHLPGAGVGVIERPRKRAEAQPEQAMRHVERRRDHRVQRQIGLDLGLIQLVLGTAPPLGVVAPVPGFECAINPIGVQHPFQNRAIGLGSGAGRAPDLHQQIAHPRRGLRHFRFQLVGGKAVIAQKPRSFVPQGQDFRGNRTVVRAIAVRAARRPGGIGPGAQVAAGGKLQEWHHQRSAQRQQMAGLTALGRSRSKTRHQKLGQPRKVGLGQRQRPVPFFGQHVLAEGGRQDRKTLLDFCHAVAVGTRQIGPCPAEHAMIKLKHTRLLWRQTQGLARGPQGGNPRPDCRVHRQLGRKRRHPRREIAHQRLARRGAVGPREIVENPRHAIERL